MIWQVFKASERLDFIHVHQNWLILPELSDAGWSSFKCPSNHLAFVHFSSLITSMSFTCILLTLQCVYKSQCYHTLSQLSVFCCVPLSHNFVSPGLLFSSISALAPFFCWICLPQLNILDFHHTCGFSYSWINTSEVNLLFLQLPLNYVTHAVWPQIIARPALWLKTDSNSVIDESCVWQLWELSFTEHTSSYLRRLSLANLTTK